MSIQRTINLFRNTVLPATLNSYAVVFFLNNRMFAAVILFVSFFNFFAGLSGLIAAVVSVLIAHAMGFDKTLIKNGIYSFNALLIGIGMGTFFDPGWVFFSLLLIATLLTLIFSVTLAGILFKYGLPFLSIPFVITFWLILLPSSQFENLGLIQRNIYGINEMYTIGGNQMRHLFQTIDSLPLFRIVENYFRSMSSIFFQNNLLSGLLIAVALLICSRIAFSLSVIGFISAYLFAGFSGSAAASITYYNIGANYMMVAIAIGGFFVIPSKHSYLWTILLVPLTSIVLLFMSKLLGFIQLPVFSLPFSVVVILFVYFLKLRTSPSALELTIFQYYSPENNLYNHRNNKERLSNLIYFPFYLPFWGEWTVSQGHDGKYTHKDDWGKAFDFMLYDDKSKSYESNGLLCENYYCYNKPVLAPADGIIEDIVDNIDDNEIGKINTTENWGNTIIIRHATGLYTQMSHLKKGTFKGSKGCTVKRGDIVAHCGNSGRSPEPHLHFQVQISPILGSKTIDYPFAYYYEKTTEGQLFTQYSKPAEGSKVSGLTANGSLKAAFDILPNSVFQICCIGKKGNEVTEKWEAFTDAYHCKYLYCKEKETSAWYVNDGSLFYFTAFYGNKESLLYYFYLSAYKVFLGDPENGELNDVMPLSIIRNKKTGLWLNDFIAPFSSYFKVWFTIRPENTDPILSARRIILKSKIQISFFGKIRTHSVGTITVKDNCIEEFTYESTKTKIKARWLNS